MNIDQYLCKWILGFEWTKPTHGRCCTCQACGRDHDKCNLLPCKFDCLDRAWNLVIALVKKDWGFACTNFTFEDRAYTVRFYNDSLSRTCKECRHFERFEAEASNTNLTAAIVEAAGICAKAIENSTKGEKVIFASDIIGLE